MIHGRQTCSQSGSDDGEVAAGRGKEVDGGPDRDGVGVNTFVVAVEVDD